MNTTTNTPTATERIAAILQNPNMEKIRQWRMLKDKIARYAMTIGGIGVIVAILLIFIYLFYVVMPLFASPHIEVVKEYVTPALQQGGKVLHLGTEEQNRVAVRFTDQANVTFYRVDDGSVISTVPLKVPAGATVTSFATGDTQSRVVAYGFSNGQMVILKANYTITYPNDVMVVTPSIEYPLGEEGVVLDDQGKAIVNLAVQISKDANTFVGVTADSRLVIGGVTKKVNFIDESETLERIGGSLALPTQTVVQHLIMDKEQKVVYLADKDGQIMRINVTDKTNPVIAQRVSGADGRKITAMSFLLGDISILVGDDTGRIIQWFPVRDAEGNPQLTRIRDFDSQSAPIIQIMPEDRRKGFAALDSTGKVGIYYATSHNTLLIEQFNATTQKVTFSPRANRMISEDGQGKTTIWALENEHPEVSLSALWGKVWYESYPKPDFIWQSSSAAFDFEPKFSLTPLAFGTIKAAFYAMLVAVPLAILGAIYAAYFMAPRMRELVKPTVEIMEALPTVILGFLAGLWLAPYVEKHLPGIFTLFLLIPVMVLVTSYVWFAFVPREFKYKIPAGWEGALLILPLLFTAWLSMTLSAPMELWLFNGDMRLWLDSVGIPFDQRNALVVGIAMGIAVIPNIFSIAEDAIFSVPKHLTAGSLALGATPWQTMTRVVLLTASPGIFSALMIGLGRAVGETLIVLMATGNTAVMDFSMFQGLRTLSANIAVEMPESEVNSTHYRLLFLAALVLFIMTFIFNTLAEVVRQRLRRKYSSL